MGTKGRGEENRGFRWVTGNGTIAAFLRAEKEGGVGEIAVAIDFV